MKVRGNTVVVTGGGSGIGLALAERFVGAGNQVVICGRDAEKLRGAEKALPGLCTVACDISVRSEREELFRHVTAAFPDVNVLINNAGIQRETDFLVGAPQLTDGESEIETNLTAGIHLAALFVPYFHRSGAECAVVNVTSGLAFVPVMSVPVYCATKAALHSFSMSLRSQLEHTNIRVFELIPPIVRTGLHRGIRSREQAEKQGIAPSRVAEKMLHAFEHDRYEVAVGRGRDLVIASRLAPHFFHRTLNRLGSG